MNEIIEDFTKDLLELNSVQNISNYFLDHTLWFRSIALNKNLKEFLKKKKEEAEKRKLKESEDRTLFGWGNSFEKMVKSLVFGVLLLM